MGRAFVLAAVTVLLAACGTALPPPEHYTESPVGSGTWTSAPADPAWVANPPAGDGVLRFVGEGKSNLRSIAVHGNGPSADAAGPVERALLPVVGAEDAAKAAAAARGAMRLAGRACREEVLTREAVPGNTLCTAWALWEVPLEAILAALPEGKRPAAREALLRVR